jgi:hypothetical protein
LKHDSEICHFQNSIGSAKKPPISRARTWVGFVRFEDKKPKELQASWRPRAKIRCSRNLTTLS